MTELQCPSELVEISETVQNIKWLDLASIPRMQNKVPKDENDKREYRLKRRKSKYPSKESYTLLKM